ncbi:MAG TPA: DUF2254 family protein, partial [Deinococcales bacterium]|nr:DUF2254 family protein [Deinococcales bacterium]
VYFIHHVSNSIRASHVIEDVGRVLDGAIDRMYPEVTGPDSHPAREPARGEAGRPVRAARDGYLLSADADALLRLAEREDLLVTVEACPGQYLVKGDPVATVWTSSTAGDALRGRVLAAFDLSSQRTELQDVEFAVEQLVEVCLRALSPSINDAFTAMNAIDRLSASLSRLVGRATPSPYRYSGSGRLRVIGRHPEIAAIVRLAFEQPRQGAIGQAAVCLRLLDAAAAIARRARQPAVLEELREQTQQIVEGSVGHLETESDRARLRDRQRHTLGVIADSFGDRRVSPAP